MFASASSPEAEYSDTLELDLSTVEPSLAGPRRPQDRVPLHDAKASFRTALKELIAAAPSKKSGTVGNVVAGDRALRCPKAAAPRSEPTIRLPTKPRRIRPRSPTARS